jgi:hypothetical protein
MVVIAAVGLVLDWVRSQGSFRYALIVASHSVVAAGRDETCVDGRAWVPVGSAGRLASG